MHENNQPSARDLLASRGDVTDPGAGGAKSFFELAPLESHSVSRSTNMSTNGGSTEGRAACFVRMMLESPNLPPSMVPNSVEFSRERSLDI